jgi:hypothetical protein
MLKYNVKGKQQWKISGSYDEVSSGKVLPEFRRQVKFYKITMRHIAKMG